MMPPCGLCGAVPYFLLLLLSNLKSPLLVPGLGLATAVCLEGPAIAAAAPPVAPLAGLYFIVVQDCPFTIGDP